MSLWPGRAFALITFVAADSRVSHLNLGSTSPDNITVTAYKAKDSNLHISQVPGNNYYIVLGRRLPLVFH